MADSSIVFSHPEGAPKTATASASGVKRVMKTRVFVVNPANGEMVSPEEWLKSENPTSAEWLVVENVDYGFKFKIHKNNLGVYDWNAAVEAAKSAGEGCRLPNRFEMITLYNAIYTENLNNVIEAIGGEVLFGWCWTGEEDDDPQCSSTHAWLADLALGVVNYGTKTTTYQVRVVSGF